MLAHAEKSRLRETPGCRDGDAIVSEPMPDSLAVARPSLISNLIYDLRIQDGDSGGYYARVAAFSDRLLDEIDQRAGAALDGYILHVIAFLSEAPRSHGEYAIELLTLGQALRRYEGAAESTPAWVVKVARFLFWLRRRPALLKPLADLLRAAITRLFLAPRIARKAKGKLCTPDSLPRLIQWLEATGEFEQETIRLKNWRSFLDTLPREEAERCIESAVGLFDWFQLEADKALGVYTQGVTRFLSAEYARRGCREDQIFCGKEPVEYHLCMVAVEIMNRGLRDDFTHTARKVVLMPACMRGAYASLCQSRTSGVDIQCAACSPDCTVNRMTRRMRSLGAKVYLVPHSTGFSRWLDRWQREPDTGVVAVACLLNILPGGYEMRARQIPSQCVPLDFPGCHKHWRSKAIATSLNEERLVQIVASP
jgi:hypothetical protein